MSESNSREMGVYSPVPSEDETESTSAVDVEDTWQSTTSASDPGLRKVLQFLILLVFCVIGPVLAAPILFASLVLVLYLQFDARNDPYEVGAQLRVYERLISFAFMVFPVVYVLTWYVIMPLVSEQHVLIETLITWLDFSLPITKGLLISEFMGFMVVLIAHLPEIFLDRLPCVYIRVAVCLCCAHFTGSEESSSGAVPVLATYLLVLFAGITGFFSLNIHGRKIVANSVLQYRINEKLLHGKYLMFYAKRLTGAILLIVMLAIYLYAECYYVGWDIIKIITAKEPGTLRLINMFNLIMVVLLLLAVRFHILSREARTVYNRYKSRIIKSGKELYFLGVLGRHTYDIFNLRYNTQAVSPSNSRFAQMVFDIAPSMQRHYMAREDDAEDEGGTQLSIKKREVYKNMLCLPNDDRPLTLDDLYKASQCFLKARGQLSKKTYPSDIHLKLQTLAENRDGRSIKEKLQKLVNGTNETGSADWDSFEELLKSVDSSQDISLPKVKAWMERAHNNCSSLANSLHSSIEALKYLEIIAFGLSTFTCCITFLGISEIVGTANLSLIIASPLVPAFIFGDTCKAMIQGMRFIYLMHPFDVGDLCVLDDKMMVVKSFDFWKTTFTMVDDVVATGAEVIYPNSELAGRKITNHKTEFDWKDCLEFNVPSSFHKKEIKELIEQIKDYLDKKEGPVKKKDKSEGEYTLDSYSIGEESSMAIDSPLKIAIQFRCNGHNTQDWTYNDCRLFKKELKVDFQMHVRDLVENIENRRHDQNSVTREGQNNVRIDTGDDGISNLS